MLGDIQDTKHALALLLAGPEFLTVLAAVDAEKAVSIATPGPTQVFEGEKATLSDQGYPTVEIVGLRTTYDANSEQAKDATHELQTIWTQIGDDELTIVAQLERLIRATRDVLWPVDGPRVLPGVNACPTEVVSEEYVGLLPTSGTAKRFGAFVKGAAITMRVRTLTV